jgi:hypothetical protein
MLNNYGMPNQVSFGEQAKRIRGGGAYKPELDPNSPFYNPMLAAQSSRDVLTEQTGQDVNDLNRTAFNRGLTPGASSFYNQRLAGIQQPANLASEQIGAQGKIEEANLAELMGNPIYNSWRNKAQQFYKQNPLTASPEGVNANYSLSELATALQSLQRQMQTYGRGY